MKRILSLLLCAALGLSLAGCGTAASGTSAGTAASGAQRYSSVLSYDTFDTVTQLVAYCGSQQEFDTQAQALEADLETYSRLYDIYNSYDGLNNLKTVNDNAGIAPVKVDSRILDLLEEGIRLYTVTGGKTNIAMGAVLSIWHDYREAGIADPAHAALPTDAELAAAAQHCDIGDIVIDRSASTVYLTDPEMSLDVGSCGKGYACEQVAKAAEARGLTSALLSVGGNLRAIGEKPGGTPWTGGVENPWSGTDLPAAGSGYVSAVTLQGNLSLVTSGDYQRYYEVDGVRYHHLIDPDTLYPARYFDSVTVLTADSGLADCLSTGLFCMDLADGQALVESMDGVEAFWCLTDGTTVQSSGWDSYAYTK